MWELKEAFFAQLSLIQKQMENSIFKIEKKGLTGTGFICEIPNNNQITSALVTCNHVLGSDDISIGKMITWIFYNKEVKNIKIYKNRAVFTSIKYDITIIELKPNEFIFDNLLKLDYDIFEKINLNDIYQNEIIYAISFSYGLKPIYSFGVIKNINNNNSIIEYFCTTEYGSSGRPIIKLENGRIIGIHLGCNATNEINVWLILKSPINEFNKISQTKSKKEINEIILKLKTGNELNFGYLLGEDK